MRGCSRLFALKKILGLRNKSLETRNPTAPRECPFGRSPVSISSYIGMAENEKRSLEILIGIGLVLAVCAVYLPVIWLDFTNYDDPAYVLENVAIQDGVVFQRSEEHTSELHS